MPKMGESVMEGTIISWLKQPGDAITTDESVLEVATDKVDTEIPSPKTGVLKKILAEKGATIPVGQTIAILEVEATDSSAMSSADASGRSKTARPASSTNADILSSADKSARSMTARPASSTDADIQSSADKSARPASSTDADIQSSADKSARSMTARPASSTNADILSSADKSARPASSTDADIQSSADASGRSTSRPASSTDADIQSSVDVSGRSTSRPASSMDADKSRAGADAESKTRRFYSPLVRSIARKEGLTNDILNSIPGTGLKDRLTKRDLMAYLSSTSSKLAPSSLGTDSGTALDDEIIDMDRMRQMIAERMVASKQISAHVTSFVEADVTSIVKWRARVKQQFYEQQKESLTLMPLFVQAVVKAIQAFPLVNISVSGSQIIRHRDIHIGMAVALPTGNLIVPVIHHADRMSLTGLAVRINDLSRRARSGELKVDELSGGTYTVSNVGTFGNLMGTPIIMQPQCAILAFGVVRKQVVVLTDDQENDTIGIRQMMYLSHSYDHRVIDGALGGIFAKQVADNLKTAEPML